MNFLFSFKGRIGRLAWWGGQLAISVWMIVVFLLFTAVTGFSIDSTTQLTDTQKADVGASATLFMLAATIPVIWVGYATIVKRFHDRDKSGLWALISFVPYIGTLWLIVECGFLSGTAGTNNYGNRGDTHSGWSPDEFETNVEGNNNLDDLIQPRLLGRQQEQSATMQSHSSAGGVQNARPVFGKRS